jgi:hypothetical protein
MRRVPTPSPMIRLVLDRQVNGTTGVISRLMGES